MLHSNNTSDSFRFKCGKDLCLVFNYINLHQIENLKFFRSIYDDT